METIHRYYDLRENIHDIAPDLLIADGDINALRLASRWKIPSVYIANMITAQLRLLIIPQSRRTLRRTLRENMPKIIIPDNPPPYTVSEYSIGNIDDMGITDKAEYVGSFVDTTPVKGGQDHIFAPISGPVGTRGKLLKTLLPVLEKVKSKCIISLGTPARRLRRKLATTNSTRGSPPRNAGSHAKRQIRDFQRWPRNLL